MCNIVDDVIDGCSVKAICLIVLLWGIKTEAKKKVLNAAVVIYVCLCCLRSKQPGDMDPYSFYQPNVMEKMLKHIFKCLNNSSVMFQQSDFQGMAGGYHALIDEYYDMVSAGKKSVFIL